MGQLFSLLALVPSQMALGIRNSLVTEAACDFISATIHKQEIDMKKKPAGVFWRSIVEFGLKHRSDDVQQAAANVMGRVTQLVECSQEISRYVTLFWLLQMARLMVAVLHVDHRT